MPRSALQDAMGQVEEVRKQRKAAEQEWQEEKAKLEASHNGTIVFQNDIDPAQTRRLLCNKNWTLSRMNCRLQPLTEKNSNKT